MRDHKRTNHAAEQQEACDSPQQHRDEPAAQARNDSATQSYAELSPEQLVQELERLKAENAELTDRLLRLAAEFENYKKRSRREMEQFKLMANEALVRELLPVVDNLERALEHLPADARNSALAQGVELVLQELNKVLAAHGLERIEAVGKAFDPELHEAMMQQHDPQADENTVLSELAPGYLFQGRLLRPAKVVVSTRAGAQEQAESDGQGDRD